MVIVNKEEQLVTCLSVRHHHQADASSYEGWGKSEHTTGLCRFLYRLLSCVGHLWRPHLELESKILAIIETTRLDLTKYRGQGYDGAGNMSGVYSGVQLLE